MIDSPSLVRQTTTLRQTCLLYNQTFTFLKIEVSISTYAMILLASSNSLATFIDASSRSIF